ncbi:MAG TPA: hypothetical protein VIK84_07270 [Haloplasmataceae bacterium]
MDENMIMSVDEQIKLDIINSLLDDDLLQINSRIKMGQVKKLLRLYAFSDYFDVPVLKQIADLILKLQISVNGLGRKELIEVFKNQGYFESLPDLPKGGTIFK